MKFEYPLILKRYTSKNVEKEIPRFFKSEKRKRKNQTHTLPIYIYIEKVLCSREVPFDIVFFFFFGTTEVRYCHVIHPTNGKSLHTRLFHTLDS